MAFKTKKQTGFFADVREIVVLLFIVFLVRTVGFGLYQVPTGSMETTMLVGERFFADKLTYWFSKPQHGDIIACNDPIYKYSKNTFMHFWENYVWGPTNWTKRVIGLPGEHIQGVIEDGKPVVYRDGIKLDEPYINKYPLLRVWKMDLAEIASRVRQGMISEDQLDELISAPKSYDPARSYSDQIFYPITINPSRVVKEENGNLLLIQPGTPIQPQANKKTFSRDGKSYWTNSDVFDVYLGPDEYWVMGDNRLGSSDSRFFGPLAGNLIHGRILYRVLSVDSDESWLLLDIIKHPIDFWKKVRWNRLFQRVR